MKRSVTLSMVLLFLVLSIAGMAQDAPAEEAPVYGWTKEAVGNLNLTQSQFDNWSQGGEDSWNWQLDFNTKMVNDQEKFNWANAGKISYGRTKTGDAASTKTADEVRLESVLTYKVGIYVNPYIAVSGLTQLTEGFSDTIAISKFLDPGYFTESVGLGYEPVPEFKTRLGVALKQTVADQFAATFTDDADTPGEVETVRTEVGVESVTDYSRSVSEQIKYTTKLELFSNLGPFDEIDVRWDNVFAANVSKYITVSFNFQLYYDKDISTVRQLKQVLAAGLSYTFL